MKYMNSALLLIEFQNEWLNENGKLNHLVASNAAFLSSIKNAEKVLAAAREFNLQIIHSGLNFSSSYKELGSAKHGLRAVIPANRTFLANTDACQFTAPFKPKENEFSVQGRIGSSAFSGSNLAAYLQNNRIDTLYIMGYALQVCVESTLRAAHDLGFESIVIEDASCAFTPEQKNYFLTEIVHHFGATTTANAFITELNQHTPIALA